MNTIHPALQRVARLDETPAGKLLAWLDSQQPAARPPLKEKPRGARVMIGFARREGRAPRPTADVMKELREGD